MLEEALERKRRSIEILKGQKIPFMEGLPVIESGDHVRVRTKEEIARRAIACLFTIQLACDLSAGQEDMVRGRAFMEELAGKFGVENCFTPKEKKFFTAVPGQQDVVDMVWKYEAYWVLLWALGIVEELEFPGEICDCDFAIWAVSGHDSFESFMEHVCLRDMDRILEEADLIFRYDWACVDARIHGRTAPGGLDAGVVLERHRAFNWLIDFDEDDDWDNVSTDT